MGITTLRVVLYAAFLLSTTLLLQGRFLAAFMTPFLALGTFFFSVALVSGLLAVITLQYVFGYAAFLAVLASDLIFNMPLVLFTSHLSIALIFAEGISALQPYQSVAQQVKYGVHENASSNLRSSFDRFRKALLRVAGSLVAISLAYGLFPDVIPTASDLAALAVYATIGLVAIALTAFYLGVRE